MKMMPGIMMNVNGKDCQMPLDNYWFLKRKVVLNEPVNADSAHRIICQLMYLDEKGEEDIEFIINSPGGSVTDGMAIYDCIRSLNSDVATIATGMAASMGAFLLAAGTKGKRYAMPNATIMIHQPLGGASGQAADIRIEAENILRVKKQLNEILAKNTGRSMDEIERDTDRNNYMTPEEAMAYGLIDHVEYPDR